MSKSLSPASVYAVLKSFVDQGNFDTDHIAAMARAVAQAHDYSGTETGLTFEITYRGYRVAVDEDAFDKMIDAEDRSDIQSLVEKLEECDGVGHVNYSGHYGDNIFFQINEEENTPEARAIISRLIEDHLEFCKRF